MGITRVLSENVHCIALHRAVHSTKRPSGEKKRRTEMPELDIDMVRKGARMKWNELKPQPVPILGSGYLNHPHAPPCAIQYSKRCLLLALFVPLLPSSTRLARSRSSALRRLCVITWLTQQAAQHSASSYCPMHASYASAPFFFFCSTFSSRARLICGSTPPNAMVARMSVSSSSSPLIAS